MKLKENMAWPPIDLHRYKMQEHNAWYTGEGVALANFYYNNDLHSHMGYDYGTSNRNSFWARQIKNDSDFFIHVPAANDIAETSSAFLFGESPLIRFKSDAETMKKAQDELDTMLTKSGLFSRLIEGAEICSAIGGIYFKVAWDSELSEHPIPVLVQCEQAFPTFKFGKLSEVTFVFEVERDGSTVFRLAETIRKGEITNELYRGTSDKLGMIVDLTECEATASLEPTVKTPDILTAVYIPNLLPNKLDRTSPMGRSDLQGIEPLMDALDEVFSAWMRDVQIARAKLHLPAGYLKKDGTGTARFNIDQSMYEELEVDPTSMTNQLVAVQFAIRAEEFEKTCLNILDRIITSAGYSPQSFGLNIEGRAESGTALNVRERKSFATTNKKQAYWEDTLKHLIKAMCLVKNQFLGGTFTNDIDVNIEFSDSINNNLSDVAASVKVLSDAKAISTDTKVRMVHPEWTNKQVEEEIERINNDGMASMAPSDPEDAIQKAMGLTNRNNQADPEL